MPTEKLQKIVNELLRTANLNLINAKLYDDKERILHHLRAAILKMQAAEKIVAPGQEKEKTNDEDYID